MARFDFPAGGGRHGRSVGSGQASPMDQLGLIRRLELIGGLSFRSVSGRPCRLRRALDTR